MRTYDVQKFLMNSSLAIVMIWLQQIECKSVTEPPKRNLQNSQLEILPHKLTLRGSRARQHLLVMATQLDGSRKDVTEEAHLKSGNNSIVRVSNKGEVVGISDGSTQIVASWKSQSSRGAVTLRDSKLQRSVSFVNDVIPLLTRAGCNQGTCHGAGSEVNPRLRFSARMASRTSGLLADWPLVLLENLGFHAVWGSSGQ